LNRAAYVGIRSAADNRRVMSIDAWQIVVAVVSPFAAAWFAVSQVGRELDNARMDDLRRVLDAVLERLARADRLVADVQAALANDDQPTLTRLTSELDDELQAAYALWAQVTLRLFDDQLNQHLYGVLNELQKIGNAAKEADERSRREVGKEIAEAAKGFGEARAQVLREGREIVGPSRRALARSRRRDSRRLLS
jgi:hypothetical protein